MVRLSRSELIIHHALKVGLLAIGASVSSLKVFDTVISSSVASKSWIGIGIKMADR